MTTDQRDQLTDSLTNQLEQHNSSYSDVREAVSDVMNMLLIALAELDTED